MKAKILKGYKLVIIRLDLLVRPGEYDRMDDVASHMDWEEFVSIKKSLMENNDVSYR